MRILIVGGKEIMIRSHGVVLVCAKLEELIMHLGFGGGDECVMEGGEGGLGNAGEFRASDCGFLSGRIGGGLFDKRCVAGGMRYWLDASIFVYVLENRCGGYADVVGHSGYGAGCC